jgi:phosphoserine phosphatase
MDSRRATLFNLNARKEIVMPIKLVIFDVDGTILQSFGWQYIHQNLGTWDAAKEYSQQFFNNQITYEEWARLDTALWKGQTIAKIREIIEQMPYTTGARETLAALKRKGIRTYLLSAGLSQVAERVQKETGIDGYTANTLLVKDGFLTGEVEVNVSFHSKDRNLPRILQRFNVTQNECAAVGDDPTLIPLFKKVALAIAFNPTSKEVEENADVTVKNKDFRKILPHLLKNNRS